jgi:hypothetical protein
MDPIIESPHHAPEQRAKARARRSAEAAEEFPLASAAAAPSPEVIARRAYDLFEQRGGDHGRDVEDWLQAERELIDPAGEAGMLTRAANEPPAN